MILLCASSYYFTIILSAIILFSKISSLSFFRIRGGIMSPFGKWDALLSRYPVTNRTSSIFISNCLLSSACRLNKPPTYHVRAGLCGRILITLNFQGSYSKSLPVLPLITINCQELVSFLMVATSSDVVSSHPYQGTPVYKVLH